MEEHVHIPINRPIGPEQNPHGVALAKPDRHVQIGKCINASFPVPWLPYLRDQQYFLQGRLIPYVREAELEAYRSAHTFEQYLVNVEALLRFSIEEDQKWKAVRNPWADFAPESSLFLVSQFFAHLMQVCKQIGSVEIAESILFMTCGMLNMPLPLPTEHTLVEGDMADSRRLTCFRLLKWVFPDPYPDGKNHFNREIIQFGCTVEKSVWNVARSAREYHHCMSHIQGKLTEMKIEEDKFYHTFDNYVVAQHPIQLVPEGIVEQPVEEEEEGGEEEEEEVEEEGEEEDQEEPEQLNPFQQLQNIQVLQNLEFAWGFRGFQFHFQ